MASLRRSRKVLAESRTPRPVKITFAGENACKIGTVGVNVDWLIRWDLRVQYSTEGSGNADDVVS